MATYSWQRNASDILNTDTAGAVRTYSTRDFGREKYDEALSVIVSQYRAPMLNSKIRELLEPGLVSFIGTTRWLGEEQHNGIEVVLGPGDSQFDMIAIAKSDAVKHDMLTGDIIKKLQEYDWLFGIDIFHAEADTIQFRLINIPDDVHAFTEDLYEFCPDIVDQRIGSLEAMEKAIESSGLVYLWWD